MVNKYGSWCLEVSSDPVVAIAILLVMLYYYKLMTRPGPGSVALPLPPGPRSLPIVGYLPFLGRELHKELTSMGDTYGPIFKFHLGSKLHVVINTPELIKEVVRHQDDIFSNRTITVAGSVLTYGGQDVGISKNDPNWRKLRKILVHEVLTPNNLEACGYFRKDEVRRTIKDVFSKVGTRIDISEISYLTTINVVKRMVWENSTGDLGTELHMVIIKIVEFLGQPNLSDFFPSLSRFDIQGVARNMKMHVQKLDDVFTSIIDDRLKCTCKLSPDGEETRKDFLQILLDLKDQQNSLNITQIKALLLDIMLGSTDSTSTLIEWVMTEIIQNTKVKKKILEELNDIVGIDNIVEESHLEKLQYLNATIKETFRLHPVAPFLIPREPSQDCIVGGFKIPKGSTIFLNIWSIHRDPRYWDNPLDFYPERFLTDIGVEKCDYNGNNMKFLPFGSGRRVCAGVRLAMKTQTFILASLLHSFDWCLPKGEEHDHSEKFGITLKKQNALIAIPSQRLSDVSLYL